MTQPRGRLRSGALFVAAIAGGAAVALTANASEARRAVTIGTVSGALGNATPGGGPAEDLTTLRRATRIVVTTPDGKSVGTLHFAAKPVAGAVRFSVDGLPLGVALTVAASRNLSGLPSPVPRGFFHAFQVQRAHADETGAQSYSVTLTPARPTATGFDFIAEPIEVFPEPSTPAPAASPATTPSAAAKP